jgi:tripartite-type tricarboxylate transporter receptor subunit TctC
MKIARLLALALAATFTLAVHAQPFPSKPIKVVVPFTPGSATDIIARTLGERLQASLGQPIVVENRPGAGGTIGALVVAQSPPDGYTLLVQSSGHTVNPHIYTSLGYDTLKDFASVTAAGDAAQRADRVAAKATSRSASSSPPRKRSPARSTTRRRAPAARRT